MKLNYTFSVLFWLYKGKMKNNLCPVYARVTIDGKRTEISTKKWVEPAKWNPDAQTVKGNNDEARNINQFLSVMKGDIEKAYLKISSAERIPAPEEIKNMILGIDTTAKPKTLCEALDYHNLKIEDAVKAGRLSPKTLIRYKTTKNRIVEFMKIHYKVADKPLPEIRLAFITEFEHHLLMKDKLQLNTTHKYIKNIKKIMNMAVGLDWIPSNPLNQFKCSYENPEREVLTQEELDIIQNKELPIKRLAEVRDVFIFCCYTGFAYADVYQLEQDAVTRGIDGEHWIKIFRQKTGTKESVPLLPIPMELIKKYRDHKYCIDYNRLLPVNSNQRYNSYLKELADLCGITKRFTTHTARHTFATTVTLANGVPIETVSSMLGHTDIRTTQIYAKVVEKKVSEDMMLLKEKFKMKAETQSELQKTGSF